MARLNGILNKLSIKAKLIIFMTALIVLTSLVNLFFFYQAYAAMADYNRMLKGYSEVNELSLILTQAMSWLEEYLTSHDNHLLIQFGDANRQACQRAVQILDSSATMDTYLWSKAIHNGFVAYDREAARLLNGQPGSGEFNRTFMRLKMISGYLETYIKQLLDEKLTEGQWHQQQLTRRVRLLRRINLWSIAGIIGFSIAFAVFLSKSVTAPLRKLTDFSAQIAKGNFSAGPVEVAASEDINILAFAFNKMARSVESMIQEITLKSDLERKLHEEEMKNLKIAEQLNEARFLALQSQINPHFLFNTLNTIARLSLFERAPRTTALIESISRIFRYNLGGAPKEVLLREELAIVREYIAIQQTRFGDRIRFSFVCECDPARLAIPRFTIQPLVENAIVHGLEPKESGGEVRVKVYQKPGAVEIKVIDNGIGILPEQAAQIMSGAGHQRGHTTGIGLGNVKERVVLYSKDEGAFRLRSRINFGTVITLRIPSETEARHV
jgi:two-component system sensor histidine kinase YesM